MYPSLNSRSRSLTLLMVASLGALTALTLTAPASSAWPPPTSASASAHASYLQSGPGRTGTVTLVTGDRVTLTQTPAGSDVRYGVQAQPAPRPDGRPISVAVMSQHSADGDKVLALPSDAATLVSAGLVDRGLFDVRYLARRGATAGTGVVPVAVRLTHPMSARTLRAAAARLPASTVSRLLGGHKAAVLNVSLAQTGRFWSSLTRMAGPGGSPSLAPGIAHVWLPHHVLGSGRYVSDGSVPLFTVTVTINARDHTQQVCGKQVYICTAGTWQYLYGITGDATGQMIQPVSITCDAPCRSLDITYSVPAGTYSAHNLVTMKIHSRWQRVEADNPEFAVGGDASLLFDLNDARHVMVSAPQPTEAYNAVWETYRSLPDGNSLSWVIIQAYGYYNFWAVPNQPPVNGTYHDKSTWVLAQPLMTASVTTPEQLALHPTYPGYRPGESTRFRGTQTLAIVAAGTGTKRDFRNVDVGGKLALLYPPENECILEKYALKNALAAGAVGVVYDAKNPSPIVGRDCDLPIYPYWFFFGGAHVKLPFIEIPDNEGKAIRALLKQGEVDVSISDHGTTTYEDDLTVVQQDQVPDSLRYRIRPSQLAHVTQHNDSATAATFDQSFTNFLPNETFGGGTEYDFTVPRTHQVYVGPVSPDLVYMHTMTKNDQFGNALEMMLRLDVYDRPGDIGSESWGDVPTEPGFPYPPTEAWQAQPGKWEPFAFCSVCRQDNIFLPWTYLATPDARQQDQMANPGIDPASVHLYHGKTEISQTQNDYGVSEYTLPEQRQSYRLTMSYLNTSTAWRFTSQKPTQDQSPRGYVCPGTLYFGLDGPCQAPGIIFVRYDAHVNAHNAVTAPGTHRMTVTAYQQAPDAPDVDDMRVWTSIDDGVTWVRARLASNGDGSYVATYHVPGLGQTTGAVSLRVEAGNTDGDTVQQTIVDAFGLVAK